MTPAELCAEIDSIAMGDFQPFLGSLVSAHDLWPAVTADALLDKPMREAIRKRFIDRFKHFDDAAAYSSWMKWYLNVFVPPVMLADLLVDRPVDVDLTALRFVLTDEWVVGAVVISRVCEGYEEDPFRRFKPLMFGHFAPLIDLWTTRTGVSPQVLWSNVGNTFEAMLRRIEGAIGPSRRLMNAQRLLDEPKWDGQPNPLYGAIQYAAINGAPVRTRRVCCLQYRLPDRCFCKACPVTSEQRVSH